MSVLFLVLDGLPARHVGPRHTPTLAGLARDGGWAPTGGRAVLPTSTYPNHATFVTGTGPREHGIHGNRGVGPDGVRDAAAVGAAGPTLFDGCRAAGRTSAAVVGDHHLVGVVHARRADEHWPPHGVLAPEVARDALGYATDAEVLARLLPVLEAAPDLVVAHLNQPDTAGHLHGPDSEAALSQYRATDAALGAVREALAPRWGEWAVVVVSDHDQETVTVDEPVDLHAAAREAGVDVTVVDEGGSALVHGSDPDPRWLDAVDGVAGHRSFSSSGELRHVWTGPGRRFGDRAVPLRGVHGSPRQQAQVAVCGGGHPGIPALAAALGRRRPSAAGWRDAVGRLVGAGPGR